MSNLKRAIALLLLLTLLLAACREAPQEPVADAEPTEAAAEENADAAESTESSEAMADVGPIKIGFMGPLTGGAAFIGQEQLGFAKVVAQIVGAEHGLEIEIVEGDTEINPDTGRIVAERFAADADIIGVVGPAGSQVCESTQPVFDEAGLAHITPSCTRTDLTTPGTATFFRPIPTDADQSKTVAAHMVELGVTALYAVEDQSSYAVGLVDELEALLGDDGVSIERASVTQEETDFSSIATAAISSGADAVFFAGQIEGQLGTLAVQLREQGYEGIYYLPDGGFSLGWVETAGAAAEGTYVSFFSPDPNLVPEAAPFNDAYTAEYGAEFGAFGGASGLSTQVLVEAIARCAATGDVSRSCVVAEMGNTDMASSMLGIPMHFGGGNQAGGGFSLFQLQDGAFNLLGGDSAMAEPAMDMSDVGPIKVAFLGPLTGGAAFIGQEQLGFAQVTIDLFNERTGLNVEIVEGDTEINPDTGRIVAERVAADAEVLAVVGPAGSQVCEATQPVFEEAGLAHITPSCTRTDLTTPGTPTFFRPIPTDADQSSTIAAHMSGDLAIGSIYMVEDQSSYAVGLVDELETLLGDAGIAVDGRASVTQEETDFSSVATAAVAAGSDVVFMAGQIEGQLGTLAVQLREQGFEGIYYLPDGGFSLGWIEAAGEAANGTYVTFFAPDPNLVEGMALYNEAYTEAYGAEFGAFGGASSFATYIALDAIESCADVGDVSRACVVEALAATDLVTTPLELPVSFGEGNQINGGSFSLFQIEDGAFNLK